MPRVFGVMVCAVLVLLASTSRLAAQGGVIRGRVTDSTGAVIVGADIRVVNTETNVAASTRSNQDGNYQAPFLNPGNYYVTVDHPGFKKAERQGIRISVSSQVALDFTLDVGAASETVNVTGTAASRSNVQSFALASSRESYTKSPSISSRRTVSTRCMDGSPSTRVTCTCW